MSKQRYRFVVLTNAVEGRDAEFNEWYTNTHLSDVLAVPGIVSAQRYVLADFQRGANPQPYKYLAIYEIETADLKWVAEEIGRRAGSSAMVISDAMASEKIAAIFQPMPALAGGKGLKRTLAG